MTVSPVKALLQKLIDLRQQEIEELKALHETLEQTPREVIENPECDFITRKGQVYARVLQRGNKLIVFPVESLGIRADDPAITRFLEPKVLEKMREKHGVQYRLETAEGSKVLRAIVVEGKGYNRNHFLNACGWALEKAAERQ